MKKIVSLLAICSAGLLAAQVSNEDLQREIDQLRLRVDRLTSGSEMHTSSEADQSSAYGLGFSADLLYWQTQADEATYAYVSSQTDMDDLPQSNQFLEQKIKWAWGFKVGMSYQFQHDNWKLGAEYTYLRPKGTSSTSYGISEDGQVSLTNASQGIQFNYGSGSEFGAKSVVSTYDLDYNYVTLQLSRGFCISRRIDVVTHMGLGSAWMNVTRNETFTGGLEAGFLGSNSLYFTEKNKYWGIGPVAGLTSFWHMGAGFSIFGDVTTEILVGKQRLNRTERVGSYDQDQVYIDAPDRYRYLPQLFMQIGLAYDYFMDDGTQHFGLRAGWENQIWFDQSVFMSESGGIESSNLQFSGFTLKALFEF